MLGLEFIFKKETQFSTFRYRGLPIPGKKKGLWGPPVENSPSE